MNRKLFAIGVGKSGIPCSLARVETINEVVAMVRHNDEHGLATRVRLMNLDQVERVVQKMEERKPLRT